MRAHPALPSTMLLGAALLLSSCQANVPSDLTASKDTPKQAATLRGERPKARFDRRLLKPIDRQDLFRGDDDAEAPEPPAADPPAEEPVAPPPAEEPVAPPVEEPASSSRWLHTEGNRILTADGQVWQGRGANIHDTRSCNACTGREDKDEVIRRIDELVDNWGANFLRLDLESYSSSSVLSDPSYLADIEAIVDHVGTKPGVYVMVSLWHDPSFTGLGWPGEGTSSVWEQLAHTFADDAHVLFGLVNEPQSNYDGALNADVWKAMNDTVASIRAVEDERGTPRHIVAVQGTGGWARHLGYYVDHPITAGGGENVAYEVHVYDPESAFNDMFVRPSETLPVIIGEFGPMHGMSMNDSARLMEIAEEHDIPYLAWTFHMRCPPNLLVDNSNAGCGIDMPLVPTDWGQLFKDRLARPWGS